jgi:Cu/Ag efflux pump CusA
MNPVRLSLRYPQVTIALTVMLVACGVYALLRMPRREDPKIHVRTGIVAAFYPGASAAEVENQVTQVTQKVEQRLFRIEGVRREKTYSIRWVPKVPLPASPVTRVVAQAFSQAFSLCVTVCCDGHFNDRP